MRELIERKPADPTDDLLTELVRDGQLRDEELVHLVRFLFLAEHETTEGMLALSVMALLQDRTRWDALRADPAMAGAAVEELLRFHTVVHQTASTRTALEDVELAGQTIRPGEAVAVSLAAASRFDSTEVCNKDDIFIVAEARAEQSAISGYLDLIRSSDPADSAKPVRVPGDRSQRSRDLSQESGVNIAPEIWNKISGLGCTPAA